MSIHRCDYCAKDTTYENYTSWEGHSWCSKKCTIGDPDYETLNENHLALINLNARWDAEATARVEAEKEAKQALRIAGHEAKISSKYSSFEDWHAAKKKVKLFKGYIALALLGPSFVLACLNLSSEAGRAIALFLFFMLPCLLFSMYSKKFRDKVPVSRTKSIALENLFGSIVQKRLIVAYEW